MNNIGMAITGFIYNIQKFSLHDGPGIRTVVFLKGCPLSCFWCSNPESLNGSPCKDNREYTLEEVLKICFEDRPFYEETTGEAGGGVTLSGGEALDQWEFSLELLRALRNEGIHSVIETSGYATREIFDKVSEAADLLLFDIKHHDDRRHVEGTGVHNELILSNFKSAVGRGIDLLPRLPVIPGYNDSAEDACSFAALFLSMGVKRLQLLPFHQLGEKKYELLNLPYSMKNIPQLHPEDLEDFKRVFTGKGMDCFI